MILRRVLAAAGAFALLAGAAPLGAQQREAAGFVAPTGPMKLTRVLERALGDGNAVVVTRSWRVRFEPRAGGFLVEGEQIAVDVQAPARLAAMAEVVRANPQAGLFPIRLDAAGLIVRDAPADLPPVPGLTEAAREYVADRSAAARAEAMRYVLAVQQAGAEMTTRWPQDLFFPTAARGDERTLPVAGGEGSLTVRFEGTLDREGERLAAAERRSVTRVGDSTRTSRETWRLEPLD